MQASLAVRASIVTVMLGLAAMACEDSTNTSPAIADAGAPFDAGQPTPPADASPLDSAPADAGVDATADADAAVPATTVLPFSTGLDGAGTPLADQQVDSHWTVKDANGAALTAYVQTDALGYPGSWLAPSTTSKFLSPFVDTVDPTGSGTFTYQTTFSLRAGVDLSAVQLVVLYASDNQMTAIRLNGQPIAGVVNGSFSTFETVTATTNFVVGANTVELVVANSGGPTGMRAELALTAN